MPDTWTGSGDRAKKKKRKKKKNRHGPESQVSNNKNEQELSET